MTIAKLVLMLVCLMSVTLGPKGVPKEAPKEAPAEARYAALLEGSGEFCRQGRSDDHGGVSTGQLRSYPSP